MKMRRIFSSITAVSAMVTILAMPGVAAANSYWHQANTETGVNTYPEHFQSTKTREQLREEAGAAAREGAIRFMGSNYPAPVKSDGAGKSRKQVIEEMTSETPAQRSARQQEMAG